MKGATVARHELSAHELTKIFQTVGGPILAVDRVNFALSSGEFFTMLGPSGCGKTTTLRMIAGLETVTSGRIIFDNQDFTRFSAFQRNIGMVFQSYALFPHLTVFENIAYGLRIRKIPEEKIREDVQRTLDLLGLQELGFRYPPDLSGGQQQRVSIARALVYEPRMLLLDEPLANIDAKLRVEMREEIRRIQKTLGITAIYVTHDQEEAMSISDRMGVFDLGRLIQLGTPYEIYKDPKSLFVADFIGKANFFPARMLKQFESGGSVALESNPDIQMDITRFNALPESEFDRIKIGHDGLVMVRPEHVNISCNAGVGIPCRVQRIQFLGNVTRYRAICDTDASEVTVDQSDYVSGIHEGEKAWVNFESRHAIFFYKGKSG